MLDIMRPLEKRIRVQYAPEEVTTRAPEVDPLAVGMTSEAVDTIWESVENLYGTGLHPAVALCIRRHGEIIIDRTIGHASGNGPDDDENESPVLATPDTLFNIFSASKAITAMVIHLLDERNLLRIDDRIVDHLPEFGRHGKDQITIRHILTHRAGIPAIPGATIDPVTLADWDAVIAFLCDAKPIFPPGRRLAYHALTGGFILGEITQRVTGKDIRTFLRDEILSPLGFDHMNFGVSAAESGRVAKNAFTGPPIPFPLAQMLEWVLGSQVENAVRASNSPEFLQGVIPSGNVIATSREASRFFELLLRGGELDGVRVFEERTVRRASTETAYMEVDLSLAMPVRYSAGFMLGNRHVGLFGPNTEQAFGHLGFFYITVFADPARDTSVCLINTGKPISPRIWPWYSVLRTIAAECPRVA